MKPIIIGDLSYMVFKKAVYLTHPPVAVFFHPPNPPIAAQSFTRDVRFSQLTRPTRPRRDAAFSQAHPPTLRTPGRALYQGYARLSRRPAPPGHNNNSGLATKIDE